MRLLEEHELVAVGGAGVDTYEFRFPSGATFTSRLEANRSTTISVHGQGWAWEWNSGQFVTCTALAAGVGFTVAFFARVANPKVLELIGKAAASGCSYLSSHTDEDGDDF